MRVALYQAWEELQPLAAAWNETLAASGSDTVFLTWEWCEAWWKNYGAGRRLFVLAARDGGELLGVAPFYVTTSRSWGSTCAALRVIGDGSHDSDYLDCFVRKGHEAEVSSAFVRFLENQRSAWDMIEITGAAASSSCLSTLAASAAERGWRSTSESIPCAVLQLPGSWDDYLASLQPRFRTTVRSSLSNLQRYVASVPSECRTPDEVDPWLYGLFDLHSRRWEREHQAGVFREAAKRSFYRDISHNALRREWLAFHQLSWGERPLAFQYGFRYHNRFYLLQEGYDPDFEVLRPGVALRSWLMRHWIEQGLEEYDFLAGCAAHKMSWGAKEKASVRLVLAANRRGEWVAVEAPQAARNLKDSVSTLLPPKLLAWKRHWRNGRAHASSNGAGQSKSGTTARLARRIASKAYSRTLLGKIGRDLATHYQWSAADRSLSRRCGPSFQIFIYHRVNNDHDAFLSATPVSEFQNQVEYLARNFHIVTLDDVADGNLPSGSEHCVAITFDDGYRDNLLYAFPILKRLGIVATIFLATGYVDSGELPWYDRVCLAFKLTVQPLLSIGALGELSLQTQAGRLQALQHTLSMLRGTSDADRLCLLGEIFDQLRVSPNLNLPNAMLTWQEVRRMSKEGISFGAHTITHPVLASLAGPRLEEEIFGSKKMVEDRLQLPVRHFAYPFGKPFDIGTEAKRVVEAAGFETAVTTVYGVNHLPQDRFDLKRFCLVEPDMGMFRLKLDWNRITDSSHAEHHYKERHTV